MKIGIVGSREFPDMNMVKEFVRSLPPGTTVVSGGARGVDQIAEMEAKACGLATIIFPAYWQRDGKAAGFIRNKLIVEAADRVVAFWDESSRGTLHSINLAKAAGKPVEVRGISK